MSSAATKSVRNMIWAFFSFFFTKVLNLIAIVILAWYLEPAEFGLMAISLAIIGYFEIVAQFGLGASLVSATEKIEENATAVLITGITFSVIIFGFVWASAGPISTFFDSPLLADLLPVIALVMVVKSLSTTNTAFLVKELNFKLKLVPEVVRGIVKGLLSILLAILGFGVWSLVIGYLAGTVALVLTTWIVRPWRPKEIPSRDTIIRVGKFGGHIIVVAMINASPRLLDNLIIGKVLGMSVLGIYSLAGRLPELVIKTSSGVIGSVMHPVMSRIQSNRQDVLEYYYGAMKYSAFVVGGFAGALAVLADPIITLLYPDTWQPAILPMQLLSIAFAISTLKMVAGNAFMATNRTDLMFQVSLINLPVFVGLLLVAAPYGIVWVAAAQIAISTITHIPNIVFLKKLIDVTASGTLKAIAPGLLTTLASAGIAYLVIVSVGPSALVQLVSGSVALLVSYLIMLKLLAPEIYAFTTAMVARKLAR